MRPIIAIPELGPGLLRRYMGSKFVSALHAAGAQVRWVKLSEAETVTRYDGLLIPGGDDIDPALYGREKSEKCGKCNPLRDAIDPKVLEAFLKTGKPILGVCRGMQMINVFLGGTLHQDIRDIQGLCHQDFKHRDSVSHTVAVKDGTLLRDILGCGEIGVNTVHHQAAEELGRGLRVSAVSPDGIVEAVELPEHPFFLGVQWHPEHMPKDENQKKILKAFVEACGKGR